MLCLHEAKYVVIVFLHGRWGGSGSPVPPLRGGHRVLLQEGKRQVLGAGTISQCFYEQNYLIVFQKVARDYVPILDWLGGYDFKSDFLSDVVAGFTVAIMHIPQGNYFLLSRNEGNLYHYFLFYYS